MSNFNQSSMKKSDQELKKHTCKLCDKSFTCGRSLGGHMRSHVINNGGNSLDKKTEALNGSSNSNDLDPEFRNDPKKALRSNDVVVLDKLCKECGKGFQSWKALFGHMKCHSDKISNTKSAISNQDSRVSQSDNENSCAQLKKSRSRNETTKRSDIDQEQETEIAMCLIMLSKDEGKWGKKIIENGCKMKKLAETDVNFDRDKRKFECTACNKSFQTYQALGGHRASHKKLKGCFDSENNNKNTIKTEPMLHHGDIINGVCEKTSDNHQSPSSFNLGSSLKNTMVVGAHECSICLRIFSSGQALGGHKRSHLIADAKPNQENPNLIEKLEKPVHEIRCFLDLNMPPEPAEDEQEQQEKIAGYNPWCYNHEPTLLGLLSTS